MILEGLAGATSDRPRAARRQAMGAPIHWRGDRGGRLDFQSGAASGCTIAPDFDPVSGEGTCFACRFCRGYGR